MFKLKNYIWAAVILFLIFLIYCFVVPFWIVSSGKKQIYVDVQTVENYDVAIVFGAGLRVNGKPSAVLADRLDAAKSLYDLGKVRKILLSGDNRFVDYNETASMYDYLLAKGVKAEDLAQDFAGRRTYDTCVRAKEIWGVKKAILITQGYHLPRAIFLCQGLGVESSGFSATNNEYFKAQYFELREIIAIHRAVVDLYFWEPEYVGGEPETDFIEKD